MAEYRRTFQCDVLTPRGRVSSVEAVSVVFPAVDGEVGILGGHAPLVARMGAGGLVIEDKSGVTTRYYVNGGFAQVLTDNMVILAEQCVDVHKLDRQAALAELDKARELPIRQRESAMRPARAKMAMIQRYQDHPKGVSRT